jgi:hypothetical protein
MCRTWHEPDQHVDSLTIITPEVLTGQVPVSVFAEEMTEVTDKGCDSRVYPVSGNCPDDDS